MLSNDNQKIINKPNTKTIGIIRGFSKSKIIDDEKEDQPHLKAKMLKVSI